MQKNRTRKGPSSPESGAGTVRERTLAHMDDLMRKATTVGASIILACGAKAHAQGPTQVVDPLPPPVGCCEDPDMLLVRGCLSQKANWVKSGMRWSIELGLSASAGPTRVSFEGLKRENIKVSGVTIKDMKVDPRKLAFALVVNASNRQGSLQFPVLCNDKKITLKLVLDLSKTPMEKGSVPVRLVKQERP